MTHSGPTKGTTLVELLVGSALGLLVLGALTAAVVTGGRLLINVNARGEAEDTAQLAVEAFAFDVRRAGYDPAVAGAEAVISAGSEQVTFTADLDGDGTVDPAAEETTGYVCLASLRRLSRVVGRQSMPIADQVVRCAFRYFDGEGTAISVPPTGLDAPARARIRALALDLALVPPGLAGLTARRVAVALRTAR